MAPSQVTVRGRELADNLSRRPATLALGDKGAEEMGAVLAIIGVIAFLALMLTSSGIRLVQQYQRGVVLRFGRLLPNVREPGMRFMIPFVDRMTKVSLQTVVLDIPSQSAITRDRGTVASHSSRTRQGGPASG